MGLASAAYDKVKDASITTKVVGGVVTGILSLSLNSCWDYGKHFLERVSTLEREVDRLKIENEFFHGKPESWHDRPSNQPMQKK